MKLDRRLQMKTSILWMVSMHSWLQLPLIVSVSMVERMMQPFLSHLSLNGLMVRMRKSKNWSGGKELSPLQQFGTSVERGLGMLASRFVPSASN